MLKLVHLVYLFIFIFKSFFLFVSDFQEAPLSADQSRLLKWLLQCKNPNNLVQANKIIKGMVKEDEWKTDVLTRRQTELVTVNSNSHLLAELLDHYDAASSGPEEAELVTELFNSYVKMQSKLVRLASETEEGNKAIADVLAASDELASHWQVRSL